MQSASSTSIPAIEDEALLLSELLLWMDQVRKHMLSWKVSARGTAGGLQVIAEAEDHERLGGAMREKSSEGDDDDDDVLADRQLEQKQEKEKGALVNFFMTEEIRKYLRLKENRSGRKNFMGANVTVGAIGHACVAMKAELEEYMDYDVGDLCKDDWPLAQRLMVHGCDPLPRRRCLARAPPYYQRPLPVDQALWVLPDNRNVRWARYTCRNFQCLQNGTRRGFSKCGNCFKLEGSRWMMSKSRAISASEFLIEDVLREKAVGEIRIGLDWSVSVGSFAARMREYNVSVVTCTLNLGAPFNEVIALRGLIPLYISLNQRLPFFDNTLDLIHTNLLLDGWIDLQFLDFIVFDWDRVLRPGGLLWIDKFFCHKTDLDDYLYIFRQLSYKKRKWVITPKFDTSIKGQLYFSALLEKPARPF
ncbi:hypothetical protein GOP47_0008186 [Adiantum capillus-veneris]|uniref:S-adenosyl-L-methionine-dependent methyltransferase superfamily protein n=1 Tax=Adiantum capillus-veneris TaxID=13818 RepID=A0A9D4ZK74_ADICA|nr:hypothetical protein GOP47_0008186 [Adiantum capillus-veneris]